MINAAISDIPPDMTIAMHLCRGNFQSTFVASGGYEPVADILFNAINVHGYFMEYDSDRAGGFEPLRLVPKGKTVVLGLVTTKSRPAGIQGRDQAPHRAGGEIHSARSALSVAAMRLRLHRGRQYPGRGRAMGEAQNDRGDRRGSVGEIVAVVPAKAGTHTPCALDRSRSMGPGASLRSAGTTKTKFAERKSYATHQTAVPRRSCRQPAAPGRAEASARAARQGRDRRRRTEGDRRPRDRARHQEAGRSRPAIDHRRRIPPLLVASRFPLGSRRRREARDGQWRRLRRPSPRATKASR